MSIPSENEKITETAIVRRLQDLLYEKNLTSQFDFSVSICSGCFVIHLHEINTQGWELEVFNSNDPFSEEIENAYEEDEYSYDVAVLHQIKQNVDQILNHLSSVNNFINDDFLKKKTA